MRWGEAVSLIGQTGHSEDTHSPDEGARTVLTRTTPASVSISVVCTVAISCRPRLLRMMSRPAASGAYRKDRSPRAIPCEGMVPTSDFAGLVSSTCALASAAASAPTLSLDRHMAILRAKQLKTDRSGFRPLGPNAMADSLPCILRHQRPQLSLGPLVFK